MPRRCNVCEHPKREEIDLALLAKESVRDIAKRFRIGHMSVQRHSETHLPVALISARDIHVAAAQGTLREKLDQIIDDGRRITAKAEQAGQLSVALAGLRTLVGALELVAKITGEYEQAPTTEFNFTMIDKFVQAAESRRPQPAIDIHPQPRETPDAES